MSFVDQFTLRLRRGDGWFFSRARAVARGLMHANLPIPGLLKPAFRLLYESHYTVKYTFIRACTYLYYEPIFRSRCERVGRHFQLWALPHVVGHTKIYIGDNVSIYGHMGVTSGRVYDDPVLQIGDGVDIGHNVFFTVNKGIIIEDEVNIASHVQIMDSDGHPRDAGLRAQKLPPFPDDVKPIRICKRAWIGIGSFIMKGVTVGEGAIIGSNSVVINDVPPFSVVLGNPARVVVKDIRAKSETPPTASPVLVGERNASPV
ncbi:MAG: acyltransferase [Acidobacteriaceae bacterium]|nr:acyltransferase [Acidobacteriaceae bacterium]